MPRVNSDAERATMKEAVKMAKHQSGTLCSLAKVIALREVGE